MRLTTARSVVAIPAQDEADRIGDCLRALASDPCDRALVVLLYANNCADDTVEAARAAASDLPLELVIRAETLPPPLAHAGEARRRAMALASALCLPSDLLLTTDADARVEPGWRRGNHRAIDAGADVVCGMAVIDPVEARAVPAHLHEDDRRETDYATLLDHLRALLDPDPADPWPRHGEESGASIAVTLPAFLDAGGVPATTLGEDRALVRRLAERDRAVRHDPSLRVIVSGRLAGRARGGMADTMRRRMECQDEHVDARLEPVSAALRRIRLRARFRAARAAGTATPDDARRLGVGVERLAEAIAAPFEGEAWRALEAASPRLAPGPKVRHRALPAHAARARRLVEALVPDGSVAPRPRLALPPIALRVAAGPDGDATAARSQRAPPVPHASGPPDGGAASASRH